MLSHLQVFESRASPNETTCSDLTLHTYSFPFPVTQHTNSIITEYGISIRFDICTTCHRDDTIFTYFNAITIKPPSSIIENVIHPIQFSTVSNGNKMCNYFHWYYVY